IFLNILLFGGYFYATKNYATKKVTSLSLDDLPTEAIFVPHPEDEEEAERLGKVPMVHYANPEAIRNGGPVYGTFGYRIVAVEYEIPFESVGIREVGDESSGYLLSIPELIAQDKNISYDHFHIGISQHADEHGVENEHKDTNENLIIHFMLIPHEEEVAMGLYCG
ncbi:MAG: hypothetical protein COU33_01890, partial [Candidatus Magasanikbacteria bacterium CG10_big_fil_rev_8_21_14_0_10_43_6]